MTDTELLRIYDLPKEIAEDVGELRKALRKKFELRSRIIFCESSPSSPYNSVWSTYWYNFEDMKRYSNVHFYVTKQKWYASHIHVKNYKLKICVPKLWSWRSSKNRATQTNESTIRANWSQKLMPRYSNALESSFMNKMPFEKNKATQPLQNVREWSTQTQETSIWVEKLIPKSYSNPWENSFMNKEPVVMNKATQTLETTQQYVWNWTYCNLI